MENLGPKESFITKIYWLDTGQYTRVDPQTVREVLKCQAGITAFSRGRAPNHALQPTRSAGASRAAERDR